MRRLPLILLGDSPRLPSGLGRIAADLASLLWTARDRLGIDLLQIGYEPEGFVSRAASLPWPFQPFTQLGQTWGLDSVATILQAYPEFTDGVLLTVWDPARCFEYSKVRVNNCAWWGYFAIDGHTTLGDFGGPAAQAIRQCDRVLAYGPYGAGVLGKILQRNVDWLPHGYWPIPAAPAARAWVEEQWGRVPPGLRLGCVASNQPRKDLSLFARTLRAWPSAIGWLHTDVEIKSWSLPELARVYGVSDRLIVSVPESIPASVGDEPFLTAFYASCRGTIAVGRGEGFGYPILESLAAGTPVVHARYAGGADLLPPEALVAPDAWDDTNPYALLRPSLDPHDVRRALEPLLERPAAVWQACAAPYQWATITPRWLEWLDTGLTALRTPAAD